MIEPKTISEAAAALKKGGVILYPTDTLYGLGADALHAEAVRKVYEIKGRPTGKPMHIVVADMAMAARYAEITPSARGLAERLLPGALTILLKAKPGFPAELLAGGETIGIRIPNNAFCLELARAFDGPFTATSANKSGGSNCLSVGEARISLADSFKEISYVVDGGILPESLPSTVVDATGEAPVIIREGALSAETIIKR